MGNYLNWKLQIMNTAEDPAPSKPAPEDVDPPVKDEDDGEDIDSDSELDDAESDEDDEKPEKPEPMSKMYEVDNTVDFLDKSWGKFSFFFGLYYILQFGMALCAANMYGHA